MTKITAEHVVQAVRNLLSKPRNPLLVETAEIH
jgi:hypothetical protein